MKTGIAETVIAVNLTKILSWVILKKWYEFQVNELNMNKRTKKLPPNKCGEEATKTDIKSVYAGNSTKTLSIMLIWVIWKRWYNFQP